VSVVESLLARIARVTLPALLWFGAAVELAHASPTPRVIVLDGKNQNLARRIRAELSFTGLTVVESPRGEFEREDVAALTDGGYDATIRILRDGSVQVDVVGSDAHGTDSRVLQPRRGEGETFPVRVVEELRARLVALGFELPDDQAPARSEREPALPAPATTEPARTTTRTTTTATATGTDQTGRAELEIAQPLTFWASGGMGGIIAAGGLGPAFAGVLGLRGQADGGGSVRLAALLPLSDSGVTAPEGEVEVSVWAFFAEAEYPTRLAQNWVLSLGLGAGLVTLAMRPEAAAPFVGTDRRLISGLYFAHLGLARELTDWLRLRASLALGISGPRPVLEFDGREVGSWGPGFGTLTLNTEIRWATAGGHAP
jgi:hypothetical protein